MKNRWYSVVVTSDKGETIATGNVMASSSEGAAYKFCEKNREYSEAFSNNYNPSLGFSVDAHLA